MDDQIHWLRNSRWSAATSWEHLSDTRPSFTSLLSQDGARMFQFSMRILCETSSDQKHKTQTQLGIAAKESPSPCEYHNLLSHTLEAETQNPNSAEHLHHVRRLRLHGRSALARRRVNGGRGVEKTTGLAWFYLTSTSERNNRWPCRSQAILFYNTLQARVGKGQNPSQMCCGTPQLPSADRRSTGLLAFLCSLPVVQPRAEACSIHHRPVENN